MPKVKPERKAAVKAKAEEAASPSSGAQRTSVPRQKLLKLRRRSKRLRKHRSHLGRCPQPLRPLRRATSIGAAKKTTSGQRLDGRDLGVDRRRLNRTSASHKVRSNNTSGPRTGRQRVASSSEGLAPADAAHRLKQKKESTVRLKPRPFATAEEADED